VIFGGIQTDEKLGDDENKKRMNSPTRRNPFLDDIYFPSFF
jgi:hypothetical protein